MAKKKTTEAVEEAAPTIAPVETSAAPVEETVTETAEVVEETAKVDSEDKAPEVEADNTPVSDAVPIEEPQKLTAEAIDYFKRHPKVDAVYIDKFGGVFPKHICKTFVKDAILYQNPNFKQ